MLLFLMVKSEVLLLLLLMLDYKNPNQTLDQLLYRIKTPFLNNQIQLTF